MDAGVAYFPTHDALGPAELARLVEERGHRWLLWAEHTHIPASRETPGAAARRPPLPRKYAHMYDPFVALGWAAGRDAAPARRHRDRLVAQRDPIVTAKEVASLDHLSGGRFELGVGAGWNREEMANHGVDPRTRMRRLREHVLAMKAIWTQHEASFDGEFVASSGSGAPQAAAEAAPADPRRRQRPHGARSRPGVRRRVDAEPRPGRHRAIGELRERADRPIEVAIMGPSPEPALLEKYERAGVDRVLFWLPSGRRSVIEPELDRIERVMYELHDVGLG